MKLQAQSQVRFPRDLVFKTYRDRLTDLVAYLPNIRSIENRSRETSGTVTKLVNVWHGGGDIPAVARAFLSEKMLSWTDHATWDEAAWTCAWQMEAHSLKEAIQASGVNEFRVSDNGCELSIVGDLSIDGKKLPIPRFLASSVGPTVEKFLVALVTPNLMEVAKGVARLLEAEAAKP